MAEKGKKREKIEEKRKDRRKGRRSGGRGALFACAYVTVVFAVVMKRYNKYNVIVLFYDKELLWEKH